MYRNAEGNSSKEKVNSLRRELAKSDNEYFGVPKTWKITEIPKDKILSGTNPNYKHDLKISSIGTERDYNDNCTNCVPAYEMRMRGYNVTAQPLSKNRSLLTNPFSAWVDVEPSQVSGLDELIAELMKYDDGSRFQIAKEENNSIWNNIKGHTFVAEKISGKIVFKDPQIGGIISKPKGNEFKFAKIDTAEISDRGISACAKGW